MSGSLDDHGPAGSARSIWSWALFQGGRDPYVILITIYVFVPYLVTSVIGDPVRGQSLVAAGAKYAGWLVMFTAPLLGATVDRMGSRKPWLAGAVGLMIPLIAALWFVGPGGAGLGVSSAIAMLALLGALFAYTETLHNALLIPAAGMTRAGRASGLALALGNLVSVAMLAFALCAFALPGKVSLPFVPAHPLFGLDPASHEPDRIVGPLVAMLLCMFSIPLFRYVRDVPSTGIRFGRAVGLACADLKNLFVQARGHRDALYYLGARLLFTDGLTGILIFIGIYAAGTMGWQALQLIVYGLILSSCSILGGLLAGRLDGLIGAKRALTVEIIGVVASQLLLLGNTRTLLFYRPYDPAANAPLWSGPIFTTAPEIGLILASMLGAITVTAAYSSSRTMLTRVAPVEKLGVFFGLFVIAGSATMWLGPLLVQLATNASGSQRIGLLPLSGLLVAGLAVLQFVNTPGSPAEHANVQA